LLIVGWDFISGMRHTVRSHSLHLARDTKNSIYTCEDGKAWSVDMLNPETTGEYLRLIHEKYWRRLKPHFGKTLKGFFFDEPHLPSLFPWTPGLGKIFRFQKGYDPMPFLAMLLVQRTNMGYDAFENPGDLIGDEKLKQVLADYHDVWTSLLAQNFYGVIQQWCHLHGVLSIGHHGGDESLRSLLGFGGIYFKNMDRVDLPGIDVIWDQVKPGRFNDFPRFAGSRAGVSGKPFALSESFAASGHGAYPDEMRFIAEHQIVRGINHFIVKLASYNPRKSFFFHPPEFNPSVNPMIRHYGILLHERMTRLSALMSEGAAGGKTCLYVPLQNYYRQGPPVTDAIDGVAEHLTYHRREYDYVWAHDLEAMKVRGGLLESAGGQTYGEILLPPGARLSAEDLRLMRSLKRRGARLVADEPATAPARQLASTVCTFEKILAMLQEPGVPLSFAEENRPISSRSRRLNGHTWAVLLLNESKELQTLISRCRRGWTLFEEDLNSRQTRRLAGNASLNFLPGESKLFFVTQRPREIKPAEFSRAGTGKPLLLSTWKLHFPGGTVRELKGRLPSWHELGRGDYSGFMRYTGRFHWKSPSRRALLDLGEVRYAATVRLNGKKAGDCVFSPFQLILGGLTKGWHDLEIDVLNTMANSVCGTEKRSRQLEKKGAFIGTYAPIYLPLDRLKIPSGLLGPVSLQPISSKK
jgi:hypothetical protein